MWDFLIKNGFVVDGSGAPGIKQDVAIQDGKVVALGRDLQGEARELIDAENLVVAPGFMDMHSHADRSIIANPKAESALRQGITFVLAGQCGGSAAPLSEETRAQMQKRFDFTIDWLSLDGFFQRLERETIGINIGMMTGQGTVRSAVMGVENRPPTEAEMAQQKELLLQSMRDGSFGLTTGRRYMPGSLATTEEIIELNRVIVPFDGLHDSHILNQDKDIIPSLNELIEIGRQSGSRVHLAHQKVCGKPNWGKAADCLKLMEDARAEGIDILSDLYLHPYTQIIAITGTVREFLKENTPDAQQLQDAEIRRTATEALRAALAANPPRHESVKRTGIIWCSETKAYEGLDMAEGAAKMGCDLAEFMIAMIVQNQGQVKTAGIMGDEDIAAILSHPYSMVGTDSFVIDDQKIDPLEAHPRNYETYPYTLRRYVYEEKLLSLECCIHKMSGMVARRLHLADRGLLQPGCWADVTIFDPNTIAPHADLVHPSEYPSGIVQVLVNGRWAVKDGVCTGTKAGMTIRNPLRHNG